MDETDVKILKLLWKDGRMPIYRISEIIGISNAAVDKRLKNMMKRGELTGFTVLLNFEKILNSIVLSIRTRRKRTEIWKNVERINGIMHFIGCLGGRYYGEFWYEDTMELQDKIELCRELFGAYRIDTYRHRRLERASISDIDWKIIMGMRKNGRIPFSKLSDNIGISSKTISKRWEKLREGNIARVYPIINRPLSRDIFWFSLFVEVENLEVGAKMEKIENVWRTSLFEEPLMIYGVFYAKNVKQIDETMENIICLRGVKKIHYEIIVEEKFYPSYLDYVYFKSRKTKIHGNLPKN